MPLRPFLERNMAIWCDYSKLTAAVKTAAALSKSAKNYPAIRGRVLLNVQDGFLHVVGTDLDVRAGTYVEAEYEPEELFEDEIVVQAESLLGVLKAAMPKTDRVGLNLVSDGRELQIGNCTDLVASIPVFDAEQWPAHPKVPEHAREYGVDSKILRYGIASTEFAAARPADEGRDSLRTLTIRDGSVLASNGKRLAIYGIRDANGLNVTFPFAAVPALLKILPRLPEEGEYVSIFHDEQEPRVWFQATTGFVTARAEAAEFPAYENMLPTKFLAEVRVDVVELKSAIEIAVACQVGETKKKAEQVIELAVDGGGLLVTEPKKRWETHVGVLLHWKGPEQHRAVYSVQYVLQALRAVGNGYVKLSFTGAKSVALASRGGWRYAFMPTIQIPK